MVRIKDIIQKIIYILVLPILYSCEVPIEVDYEVPVPQIVVDGLITDLPGPYEVILTYSGAYTSGSDGNNPPVTGAEVVISDDVGNIEFLREARPGRYLTSDFFKGNIGRVYTLSITTREGKTIESSPEEMLPVPPVDSIYYHFQYLSDPSKQGHNVYAVVNDPEDETNFYRWKWDGYYRFFMVTEMDVISCWRHEYDLNRITVVSDRDFNGNKIYHPVSFIPHFANDEYLIHIFQYSLTENAFKFWNTLSEQSSNVGSIFDPQPARVKGNLTYVDGTQEPVLGYFGASSVSTRHLFMNFKPGVSPEYPRTYAVKPCESYRDSFTYNPSDPSSWPEGWGK
jgi:hypothetical protein